MALLRRNDDDQHFGRENLSALHKNETGFEEIEKQNQSWCRESSAIIVL